uniref:Uncharacterized protein n=1 Tax=Heliothis virescens TaxID=7102 RepID=A0A2A4J647_HELVI
MKTLISVSAIVLVTSAIVAGQRPFFAGSRPIGFPETPNRTTTTPDPLDNRFGEGTTQRLPIEANGDRDLIDRLSKLPIDKQPFWFINWQALEANRKDPQTYPQRPSGFVDPIPSSGNGLGDRFSGSGLTSSNVNTNVNTPITNQPNNNGNLNSNNGFGNGQFAQASASSQSGNNFNSNPGSGFGQFAQAPPSIPNQPTFNPNFGSNDKNNQVAQTTVVSPTLASSYNPNFDSNHGFYDISGQYIQTPPIVPYPSNNFNSNAGLGSQNGQFVQTTQRYQWNAFASTNSQFNRYPEFNTQTANTKNTGR